MKRPALTLLLLHPIAAAAQPFTVSFPKEVSAQPLSERSAAKGVEGPAFALAFALAFAFSFAFAFAFALYNDLSS